MLVTTSATRLKSRIIVVHKDYCIVFRQSVEDLQTGLYKILDRLKNHEDAWPFLDPVEEEYAPRYYSVIAKPMDLQRMEDKLDAGEYSSFNDFKSDFQLIVDNCRQYNGSENEYTEMVGKLQEAFDAAVDRYLETEISTDEEVAVEFPGEQKGRRRKTSQASKHSPAPSHRSNESDNEIENAETVKEESDVEDSQKDTESQSSETRSRYKGPKKTLETKRPGKKPVAIKNVTDIEALELATEQTLKDINKWLDDTPKFSEFSSASNSPSQLPLVEDCDGVAARIENEYRARLKMRSKDKVVRLGKDPAFVHYVNWDTLAATEDESLEQRKRLLTGVWCCSGVGGSSEREPGCSSCLQALGELVSSESGVHVQLPRRSENGEYDRATF
ncbi:hypothetical protein J6590_040558 [Homalodisca vitripennis]|nr:hypothetical protein J6590_040558 [Homalodisca vitripennis]